MFVQFSLWLCYISLCIFSFIILKNRKIDKIGFSEGVLVGLIYFLAVPMFFVLSQGYLTAEGIYAPTYFPYEDLKTTLNIFLGWLTILFSIVFISRNNKIEFSEKKISLGKFYFKLMLFLYVFFTLYSVYSSGLGSEGSHWHGTAATAFQESSMYIFIRNFSGAFRVMLYGGIIWLFLYKIISLKKALFIGLIIALFDLSLTFNRILLVFYFLTALVILGKYRKYALLSTIFLLPIIAFLSNAWPNFRSTVFNSKLNYQSVNEAWISSIDNVKNSGLDFSEMMNGLFESSNIVVYNFIVNNFGENLPLYYGYTFILRPLTTFLPSTIWAEKPRVFGTYLGEIINSYPGLALNSTLLGEVYANFYLMWPLFLFCFILLFDRIFNYINSVVPFSNYMGFVIAIALWRFDANFASVCIYSIVLLIIIKIGYFNILKSFVKK